MKVKVCGMKMPLNMQQLDQLNVDYLGFIFAKESPRYVGDHLALANTIAELKTEKVGVFVNEEESEIRRIAEKFGLSTIQLHGEEPIELIEQLKNDFTVIKAIPVYDELNSEHEKYSAADYFLFDSKGPKRGGNGVKFKWDVLENYTGETPFFLSGGIAPGDLNAILDFQHQKCVGVDVNSRFEVFPGFKKVDEVEQFIAALKKQEAMKSI